MKNEKTVIQKEPNRYAPIPPDDDGPDPLVMAFIFGLMLVLLFMFFYQPYIIGSCN